MKISDGWVLHRPTSSFSPTKSFTRSLESTKMLRQFLKTWQVLVTPIVSKESWSSGLKMLDFLAFWNFLAWLGLFGLAGNLGLDSTSGLDGTSWPGWHFLDWPGLLGLAGISWPGWDFLGWLGLLGLAGTSWPGWDFLAWLGLLGNWWNKLKLCCLYTPIMLKFENWIYKIESTKFEFHNFKFPKLSGGIFIFPRSIIPQRIRMAWEYSFSHALLFPRE